MIPDLPNLSPDALRLPQIEGHPPRILLLYGSLRERSFSRFATQEAQRLLRHFGCETGVSMPMACRFPMMRMPIIPKCGNCAPSASGPRVRSGPAPSGMAR